MSQATGNRSRRAVGRILGGVAAALLLAAAVIQPQVVNADDGGRHFHAVFGFGGIFSPFWWSPFWWFGGYPDNEYYGNYRDHRNYGYDPGSSYYGNYPDSGYRSPPNARQTWYYCSKPAGYYPSVTHCNTVWEYGPGSPINRDWAASARGSHVAK